MSISVNAAGVVGGVSVPTGSQPASQQGAVASDAPAAPEVRSEQPVPATPAPLQMQERGVQFQVDAATGMTIVRVVNKATGEVVRQIPNEVVIRIAQYLRSECGDCGGFDVTA